MVKIWLHSLFLRDTEIAVDDEIQVTLSNAALSEVLQDACRGDDRLLFKIIDEQGSLRPHVAVFINSVNCRDLQGLASVVKPDDEVLVFPALSGG